MTPSGESSSFGNFADGAHAFDAGRITGALVDALGSHRVATVEDDDGNYKPEAIVAFNRAYRIRIEVWDGE